MSRLYLIPVQGLRTRMKADLSDLYGEDHLCFQKQMTQRGSAPGLFPLETFFLPLLWRIGCFFFFSSSDRM